MKKAKNKILFFQIILFGCVLLIAAQVSIGEQVENSILADNIRKTWKRLMKESLKSQEVLGYPYMNCFQKASRKHGIPVAFLLGVARGESNFNPNARSAKECLGIMQIQWPDTARDLGIQYRSDLFKPCVNIDAGARYLSYLLKRNNNDPYMTLVSYYMGPSGIRLKRIPKKVKNYTRYIYGHLQHVLTHPFGTQKRVLILSFTHYQSASDFAAYLKKRINGIPLAIFKSRTYTYNVYITYENIELREQYIKSLEHETGIKPFKRGVL